MHPYLTNWPGSGQPPLFDISSDGDGSVVVEFAWDPQALLAPAAYPDALRYWTSASDFNAATVDDDGSPRAVAVPAASIQLAGNRATWTMPASLWAAYAQEALKSLRSPPSTTFSCNLYYRIRVTPAGASTSTIWPSDDVLSGDNAAAAPRVGILVLDSKPSALAVPDPEAVAAIGGTASDPTRWSDAVTWCWATLPESDDARRSLEGVFDHTAFKGAAPPARAGLLKLWLFAGPAARARLPQLLDRTVAGGNGQLQPVVGKADLRGGKSLVDNLLDLLTIAPHPDLVTVLTKEQLVDDVITEILDPNGQVDEAVGGTCSPTAIQALLITANPAEYARLQVGLLGVGGTASLAGGDAVAVPSGVFQASRYAIPIGSNVFAVRTNSELAFQAAVLAYGQGASFPALTGSAGDINAAFQGAVVNGLTADQGKRALSGLFGTGFTVRQVSWPPQPDQQAWLDAQAGVLTALLADLAAKPGQLILDLFWNQPPTSGADVTHAVLAIRHDPGKVLFRNPQYAGSSAPSFAVAGGTSSLPPRLYEDPSQAMESMLDGDLGGWILGYFSPDTAII
jgi:hypothetical protein